MICNKLLTDLELFRLNKFIGLLIHTIRTQNSYYHYDNLPHMHPLTKESIFDFETSFDLNYGFWNSSPQKDLFRILFFLFYIFLFFFFFNGFYIYFFSFSIYFFFSFKFFTL
ncbi:hypothetical protein CANARDRAFT_61590 [[Candida] arabinofermentans NRRL YB-2248]|uniref:Uncharacterized protein n=1 Tax=[Candida] arabinofermentans NRRL YB-2248 TaxID=983967 RepID=A0A1E4SYQ8_9ASCO|nr:hypothetical protein CANARDRAFT_61590 [[Candida] arabinofermentans NRRL YB-2248]